jgi:hypothetical protein
MDSKMLARKLPLRVAVIIQEGRICADKVIIWFSEGPTMVKKFLAAAALFLAFTSAQAYTPQLRPLSSVDTEVFLRMNQDAQKLYVSGVVDGFTFVTYGHGYSNHDAVVKCLNAKNVGDLTTGVVDWLKTHPAFREGLSSAVVQTVNVFCG